MKMRRVVVTGCGVVSPVGIGKNSVWDSLTTGRSGVGKITHFDAKDFDSRIAGEINDFEPPSYFSPKDVRKTPRFAQFALVAAQEALEESGLNLEQVDPYQVGSIIGSGVGSLETVEKEYTVLLEKGPRRLSPFLLSSRILS